MMGFIIGVVLAAIVYGVGSVAFDINPTTSEIILIAAACGVFTVCIDASKK